MAPDPATLERIHEAVRRHWGYDNLRPLQIEAIEAALGRRDSLTVLPTGGGKSLCYQVPPLLTGRLTVVVSPLISLMKDQVDGLLLNGYPARALNSEMGPEEVREAEQRILSGEVKLVFAAPERLVSNRFLALIERAGVDSFAIDEAHCISQWGHDFRPEYRQLAELRQRFPEASLHAFTATATPRVRDDIVAQLRLRQPAVLVGDFDRPNLTYRVLVRKQREEQVMEVLNRHQGEAVIIYCLSRRDTEELAAELRARGVDAGSYHAGMAGGERRRVQEAFSQERLNVIVATVAFGMGIDRSDVRCVIHATLPKSIEHYQQETGRAGRDGLPAECVLLYTSGDAGRWARLLEGSPDEQFALLREMTAYASSSTCRHKALSAYFGQSYGRDNCDACDICLSELTVVPGSAEIVRRILQGVFDLDERFGGRQVRDVLRGRPTQKVVAAGHNRAASYGALQELSSEDLASYIAQLVDQGVLSAAGGGYPTLSLSDRGRSILAGEAEVLLHGRPDQRRLRRSAPVMAPADDGLFRHLREWRRDLARERDVPPYVIFSDMTLQDIARKRPRSFAQLLTVRGIGQKKASDLGESLLAVLRGWEGAAAPAAPPPQRDVTAAGPPRAGAVPEQAAMDMGRRGDVSDELVRQIATTRPSNLDAWVSPADVADARTAFAELGMLRLKPVHERLGGRLTLDELKLVRAFLLMNEQALDGEEREEAVL
ncbi:MAG: RecQ family ATP-dependent DNA helicase [Dehalococcoidia bacterium]